MAKLQQNITVCLIFEKVLVFANVFMLQRSMNFDFGLKLKKHKRILSMEEGKKTNKFHDKKSNARLTS
jgi:hypothetical protein